MVADIENNFSVTQIEGDTQYDVYNPRSDRWPRQPPQTAAEHAVFDPR